MNIALANQFALLAQGAGIDVHKVIEAANSQPYSHIHRPGISVGGHCIPVYPRLFLWGDPDADLVRVARGVNAAMPSRCVDRLAEAYGDLRGATVAVLGAAYRGGVKETVFSGVFSVVDRLEEVGAVPVVHDPMYSAHELEGLGFVPYEPGEPVEAAIIHTDHSAYRDLEITDLPGAKVLWDGRGILNESNFESSMLYRLGSSTKA